MTQTTEKGGWVKAEKDEFLIKFVPISNTGSKKHNIYLILKLPCWVWIRKKKQTFITRKSPRAMFLRGKVKKKKERSIHKKVSEVNLLKTPIFSLLFTFSFIIYEYVYVSSKGKSPCSDFPCSFSCPCSIYIVPWEKKRVSLFGKTVIKMVFSFSFWGKAYLSLILFLTHFSILHRLSFHFSV